MKSARCVRVVDCRGEPVEIPFKVFAHIPLRNILNSASEFLLELHNGSTPILAATGVQTLKIALHMQPERALPFHVVLTALIPRWTSEMMDKSLIELPIGKMDDAGTSEAIDRIQRLAVAQRETMA